MIYKTKLTSNTSTAEDPIGTIRYEYDHSDNCTKVYKYVVVASDTTVADGTPLGYTDVKGTTVSYDLDDFVESANIAGVGVGAITAGYYGWVQIKGYHDAVLTNGDDDIAKGDWIIYGASDGVVDSSASGGTAPVYKTFGIAVADDVNGSNTVAVMLDCPF